MNDEKIAEILKKEIIKRYYVEDNREFIGDKKGLAYKIFNAIEVYDPDFVAKLRDHWGYDETKDAL